MLEGITYDIGAILESMYYGGWCFLHVDDMWNLFESLTSYQWQCECASESFLALLYLPIACALNLLV